MGKAIAKSKRVELFALMREEIPDCYAEDHSAEKFITFMENGKLDFGEGFVAYKKLLGSVQTRELKDGSFKKIHYAPKTQNHYLDAALNRINHVLKTQENRFSPAELSYVKGKLKENGKRVKIDSVKVADNKKLTPEEIGKLITECPDKDTSLMIEFLFHTGARISEALNILLTDMKPTRNGHYAITLVGKGDKGGTIKPPKDLVNRIKKHFGGKEYLFQKADGSRDRRETISIRIGRHSERILGRHTSAHCLRHSLATYLFKKYGTERLKAIQHVLRHAKAATTLDLYVDDDFGDDEHATIAKDLNDKMFD